MLESCLEIQKSVLLPALAELPGADLPSLAHGMGALLEGKQLERPDELDVREIPHGQRHPRIFGIYARLGDGESFVLVNNHDPKPLRREFDALSRASTRGTTSSRARRGGGSASAAPLLLDSGDRTAAEAHYDRLQHDGTFRPAEHSL